MQVASILSDLTSLRVCDHSAALALVSARASPTLNQAISTPFSQTDPSARSPNPSIIDQKSNTEYETKDVDLDLLRATDLVELHHGVKMKHVQEGNKSLLQARRDVDGVLERLRRHKSVEGRT